MKRTLLLLFLAGCAGNIESPVAGRDDDLTSVGGNVKTIEWDGFVYADPASPLAEIQNLIQRQVKSSLGALREKSIGIADRDALHNLDPAGWRRETVAVVDPVTGQTRRTLQRVRYHYTDTALVGKRTDPGTALNFTLLFGDYVAGSAALQPKCVDEPSEPDSLWYHYAPARAACAAAISAETQAINAELSRLIDPTAQIPPSDAARVFLPVRAKLTAISAAPTKYPEYDRLWGFGSDRAKVVEYAFVGVDHDLRDSHDLGAIEYQRLLRTLREKIPSLKVTYTQPFAMLLDFWVDGKKLEGVTFEDVSRWMIDEAGYPASVGTDSQKREALRQQVIDRFAERWIVLTAPATVEKNGERRQMTVEIRTYWGKEDGDPTSRQHAQWRYLEAFWHGDVFSYTGHSHFGHGPLEPTLYNSWNFPSRYQVMLVNSCLSYNYYDLDFLAMHPNGSRDLDVVVNGLPAYWSGMGESSAKYLSSLVDGTGKSWAQILEAMKVKDPWGVAGYEPMRGANGELDNVYDATANPIRVTY